MANRIFVFLLVASATASLFTSVGSITGRVIGGRDADENAFPYQVSIRANGYHICGGSLIDYQWVLTAAHCLINRDINTLFVVAGSNSIMSGGTAYYVESVKIHENYSANPMRNDIGLIKIIGHFVYSNKTAPIQLPDKDIDETNCTAIFTGWGETKGLSGTDDKWLQLINLHIMPLTRCYQIYPSIVESNICTYNNYTQGICFGDSGGPLVIGNVQIGLASWVTPCARGYPDVHTRVYSYLDWIKSHIS